MGFLSLNMAAIAVIQYDPYFKSLSVCDIDLSEFKLLWQIMIVPVQPEELVPLCQVSNLYPITQGKDKITWYTEPLPLPGTVMEEISYKRYGERRKIN